MISFVKENRDSHQHCSLKDFVSEFWGTQAGIGKQIPGMSPEFPVLDLLSEQYWDSHRL